MVTVSIRFNSYLATWLVEYSCNNRISISGFITDLLLEKAQSGKLEFKRVKLKHTPQINPSYKHTFERIVFTAKLMEMFIIYTEVDGIEIRKQAWQETNELLEILNINDTKNKDKQLCISLDQQLHSWIKLEAIRLKVKTASLIRNIIENKFVSILPSIDWNTVNTTKNLCTKYQMINCELLERFLKETVEDADFIIKKAREATNNLINNIYHQSSTMFNDLKS